MLSAYQLLRQKFNPAVQRTASAIFLLTRTVADGLRLYLAALLLEQFTGWDRATSIVGTAIVTMIYTYLGGMQAVIWTDLIQFVIYVTGAILAFLFMLQQIPGGAERFVEVGQAAGKFDLFDFSTNLTRRFTFWAGVLGGSFLTMASHGADQIMVQRYLCSRSVGQARTALILSGLVVVAQFFLFLLIGIGLFVLWHEHALDFPPGVAEHHDAVFGYYIVTALPTGVVGLLIAAVLAASMSSLSSSLNSASSAFVGDFYRPLRPDMSETHYLNVSRGMTMFWGLTRLAVALLAIRLLEDRSVINSVLSIAGFTTGMILGLFVLGRFWPSVRSAAALGGLVAGFATVFTIWIQSALAWPWYPLVGTLTTVAVALFISAGHHRYGSSANRGP